MAYATVTCYNGNVYVAKSRRHFKWLKWHFGWIYGIKHIQKENT